MESVSRMTGSREPPFAQNFGLMMTYRCQVACPHCIVKAGPNRKEEVAVEEACNWIDQMAAYRGGLIRVLALTGGEPFFNLSNLRAVGGHAKACGLAVTAVTNGYWAGSYDEALGILAGLPFLDSVAISTDVYHQAAIPLARVRNAATACATAGIPFAVSVCTENVADPDYLAIVQALHEFCEADRVLTAIVAPVVPAAMSWWTAYRRQPVPAATRPSSSPMGGSLLASAR
jgi:pyruvate-formate lyase-activating enzyme